MKSTHNKNEVYYSIVNQLPRCRKKVFDIIAQNENITIQELSELAMRPINEVSPRVTELKNSYLIIETGYEKNLQTHKKNTTYKIIDNFQDRKRIINTTNNLLLERVKRLKIDVEKCSSKQTKELIKREITKCKNRIADLSKIAMVNNDENC